jgi:BRCT domain type II-containing protein
MNFNDLGYSDVIDSLIAETAKAINETRHAQDDLQKADSRLRFILAALHNLKMRNKDKKDQDLWT